MLMTQFRGFGLYFFASLVLVVVRAANGASIVSAPFSLGFGYSASQVFDTTETAAANTPTTIGAFSFNAAPVSDRWSSHGVTFVNRVLADGPPDGDYSANIDTPAFTLPVTAKYNGPAPSDASATPNYQLRLELSEVSIYAGAYPSSSLQSLAWDEVTPGHLATSSSVALPNGDWASASAYTQVAWDPGDYNLPLAGLNGAVTRTFDILGGNGLRYGDGIELVGSVSLIYDAVPEPTSFGFVGLAAALTVLRRWKFSRFLS
jgi:hypothetical protein